MVHGSVFSGLGGFDLAAQWMEWDNKFYCEIDPFCRRILKYYWPHAEEYTDIKEFNATKFRGVVEIVTGGFPCQPFSIAGQRRGMEDNRYLWPEMLRIIGEIQPRWILAENVPGLLNWKKGLVFNKVQTDLEAAGYEVQPVVLPACAVGAPHLRYRLWFVAYSNEFRQLGHKKSPKGVNTFDWRQTFSDFNGDGTRWTSTYSDCTGLERTAGQSISSTGGRFEWYSSIPVWDKWPTQSPVCSRDDGIPRELDGVTFSNWRAQSIHALGNAIVPQVALQIFRSIEEMNNRINTL
ncbi:DNA cytosine methyltransferase [Chitinophaga filiformis]|uniref:Cytosine-specific methyltransferase n=1 Tax=Chitinophaga filiformis TaxID=104663 RepID=A0ABY4HWB6_CHIFI|nr:DNA (cytosine-5-)-methyltransferase [Chitinophaga filiformis]UPK68077.1 DNA cytosine methyltransferase [Chitinophaga filiformis]